MHKIFLLLLYTFFFSINLYANSETIGILSELKKSHLILDKEIDAKLKLKKKSLEPREIEHLTQEIKLLQNENDNFQNKFDKIASGIDTTLIENQFESSNKTQ